MRNAVTFCRQAVLNHLGVKLLTHPSKALHNKRKQWQNSNITAVKKRKCNFNNTAITSSTIKRLDPNAMKATENAS